MFGVSDSFDLCPVVWGSDVVGFLLPWKPSHIDIVIFGDLNNISVKS